jgi:HBS1 N-terminus
MSEEDRTAMDEGVAHIYSVIGDDASVSLQTIQETLWYYYFDKEESVNFILGILDCLVLLFICINRLTVRFILDTIATQKSAVAKEASKAAASKGMHNVFFYNVFLLVPSPCHSLLPFLWHHSASYTTGAICVKSSKQLL